VSESGGVGHICIFGAVEGLELVWARLRDAVGAVNITPGACKDTTRTAKVLIGFAPNFTMAPMDFLLRVNAHAPRFMLLNCYLPQMNRSQHCQAHAFSKIRI
jgi:hypothetical protein